MLNLIRFLAYGQQQVNYLISANNVSIVYQSAEYSIPCVFHFPLIFSKYRLSLPIMSLENTLYRLARLKEVILVIIS